LALFGLNSKVLINYHQDFIGIITNNLTTTPQMMSSAASTPLKLNATASQASATTSGTPLPDVLARMMARLPAMSSECERLFSSCVKQTTPESSNLSGEILAHQQCLSNWHRRGAIKLEQCWDAIPLA
jgi:hypothetical protein